MPEICKYRCNKCGAVLSSGWGGYVYVENEEGVRIPCHHPTELIEIMEVLKIKTPKTGKQSVVDFLNFQIKFLREGFPEDIENLVKSRVGFNFECICLDCLYKFYADVGSAEMIESFHKRCPDLLDGVFRRYYMPKEPKDERKCPRCGSANVKTILELVGQTCPICREGVIEEIDTGVIS